MGMGIGMNNQNKDSTSNTTWFVGASFGGTNDQTQRFLAEGVWEVRNPTDKEIALVRSMQQGERIAIKAAYTRKHGVAFDNRSRTVSVMGIKAIGTILNNPQNGEHVQVKWQPLESVREWYFYTYRATIWRVLPGDWMNDALIAFAFEGKSQDLDRFRNEPFWRERYGRTSPEEQRFQWTDFYEAFADKLLTYRSNRAELVKGIRDISVRVEGLGHLAEDQYADGTTGFVKDICPFTTMGLFNRGVKDSNRKIIADELAKFLGVDKSVPESFEGIPLLNNLSSWFFPFEISRDPDHIDALWEVFEAGIKFADSDAEEVRAEFAKAFDNGNGRSGVAWNLTFGLYWIRPWAFLSLDRGSQTYITKKLSVPIGLHGPKKLCNSADYLAVMDVLERRFQEASYPVHSYPELSLEAWGYKVPTSESPTPNTPSEGDDDTDADAFAQQTDRIEPYSVEDILKDGCFLEQAEIDLLLDRLRTKKNLILQGPPGTGKTWLAKRLAFALMGQKDDSKVRAVQFHPNLSYEDFVRGWRPTGEGKLSLADGVFMEAIKAASKDPLSKFVVVIEEINRGNPAQIFGELLTLLEAGKRTPSEALELCYPDADGKRRPVHIPENLYVVGTMNIADRSLALVDMALRRRFAFVGLEPRLGKEWRDWVVNERNVDPILVTDIERRITELNDQIGADASLGKPFRIGHSYVTPVHSLEAGDSKKWFQQVVETEIGPLLDEYWFDAPDEAKQAIARLTQGW